MPLALLMAASVALAVGPADTVVGHFRSFYAVHARNRAQNIEIAAQTLDGAVIPEGATLSFNARVGRRSEAYLPDRVFVNHRVALGRGGGICQLASTVYAAALRAGMTITERHPHGLPVAYVPLGEDATIAFGLLDLRFRNDGPGPVVLDVKAKDGTIDVAFRGRPRPYTIEVRHDTLATVPHGVEVIPQAPPPPLSPSGGLDGKTVRTWLLVHHRDGHEERITMSKDTYPPLPRQIVAAKAPGASGPVS